MIPKLRNAVKNSVSPSSWKPSTDTPVSPNTSNFTPADTPPKSASSNDPAVEHLNLTNMEETAEGTPAKQEAKASDSEGIKAKEEVNPLKPESPSKSKEPNSTNTKAKPCMCKKHAKGSKKKAKRHSKTVESDSSSDSDDSSSDSSTSCSTDDSSDSFSEDEEAARQKRRSKARRAKKLRAKKRARAKAKAEETDSDSDDESSSEEEEKKKSKRKRQAKKKKRSRKSKDVEEEDDDEGEDNDDEVNTAFNRQQLAQIQAMNLKRMGRALVGRGNTGESTNAKAKGKPRKRSVFCNSSSIKFQEVTITPVLYKVCHEYSPQDGPGFCADHHGRMCPR